MLKIYADLTFYSDSYLMGRASKIPDADFSYWAMMASGIIRNSTFGQADELEDIPEEMKMCCCEIAEKLYSVESVKDENGMILQSYGNDGETGTYKMDDVSETAVNRRVLKIIRKWLNYTGLLYCGVK